MSVKLIFLSIWNECFWEIRQLIQNDIQSTINLTELIFHSSAYVIFDWYLNPIRLAFSLVYLISMAFVCYENIFKMMTNLKSIGIFPLGVLACIRNPPSWFTFNLRYNFLWFVRFGFLFFFFFQFISCTIFTVNFCFHPCYMNTIVFNDHIW